MMSRDSDDIALSDDDATNVLNTVVDPKTGDVLGGLFKLPEPLLSIFKVVQPSLKGLITKAGKEPIRNAVTSLAAKIPYTREYAGSAGMIAGNGFAYLFPYVDNIGSVYKTVDIHRKTKKKLFENLAPLLAANKSAQHKGVLGGVTHLFSGGYEDNKMVATALKVITDNTYHQLASDATNAIPNIAVNYAEILRGKQQAATTPDLIEKYEKHLKFMDNFGFFISGGLGEGLNKMVTRNERPEQIEQTSLGKVLALQEYLHSNDLDGPKAHPKDSDVREVTQYVKDAFKQFQKEQGYSAIPSHRLGEAAKRIAHVILHTDMSALALVNIIGREELLNTKKNGLVSPEKIDAVLQKETHALSKASAMNVEEFLAEMHYTLDDVKTHLHSDNKDEKALVVLMHEEPVLLAAGMKKEEIEALRKHIDNRVMDHILARVVGDLAKQSDAQLEEHGFDAEAIDFVREHAGNPDSIGCVLREPNQKKEVMNVARTALMGEDSHYWQSVIAQSKGDGHSASAGEDDASKKSKAKPRPLGAAEIAASRREQQPEEDRIR